MLDRAREGVFLEFDQVGVDFPIYSAHGRSFKRSFIQLTTGGRMGLDARDRVAVTGLNDISFVARKGERIALIGHNGAGKSTLLRAAAGVYEPVRGTLTISGSVSSLIDLTLGMDMEATGFENIRIRGLLMGFSPTEISRRTAEIADATELGDFLAIPIRTYSSGMLLRLAFAISTSLVPDILLMDEWISVGDASFVKKAQDRLRSMVGKTGIMLMASHSPDIIYETCNRALWLEKGVLRADGAPRAVWAEYAAWAAQRST
jgi:lipopolysaccharide transport system ATP-binding protein